MKIYVLSLSKTRDDPYKVIGAFLNENTMRDVGYTFRKKDPKYSVEYKRKDGYVFQFDIFRADDPANRIGGGGF